MEDLALTSYAKINLGLLLLGKRLDDYHDIATVFQQIDLYDEITFRKKPSSITISSSDSTIPLNEENLVHRAFTLFKHNAKIKQGIEVHIEKRIPVGGGLGGGSSNAAVTLLAANRLWGNPFTHSELERMASEIGSDVPFFLLGGTALGQGRGEILQALDWPGDFWVVLICPDIRVSTSWAYSQSKIDLTKEEKFIKFMALFKMYTPQTLRDQLVNELESVVFQMHPLLREIKEQLYQRDAFYASMSGSGSTVYGLFFEKKPAERAKSFFSIDQGLTTYLCRPISIHPPV